MAPEVVIRPTLKPFYIQTNLNATEAKATGRSPLRADHEAPGSETPTRFEIDAGQDCIAQDPACDGTFAEGLRLRVAFDGQQHMVP